MEDGRACIYSFGSYVYILGSITQASPLVDSTRLFVMLFLGVNRDLTTLAFLFLKTVNFYTLSSFSSGNYFWMTYILMNFQLPVIVTLFACLQ